MAQSSTATSSFPRTELESSKLSEREAFEVRQYEKILRLQKVFLDGKHPLNTAVPGADASATSKSQKSPFKCDGANAPSKIDKDGVVNGTSSDQAVSSGSVEFDPVLLEKSGQLVRAELQLQRQRLEQALRKEVEQRRSAKAALSEPTSDLDLSDVLAKALTLVRATMTRHTDGEGTKVDDNASDSLDASTFYSSRHDTPESHLTSRLCDKSDDVPDTNPVTRDTRPGESLHQANQQGPPRAPTPAAQKKPTVISSQPLTIEMAAQVASANPLAPQISIVPGLNNYVQTPAQPLGVGNPPDGGDLIRPNDAHRHNAPAARPDIPSLASQSANDTRATSHPPSPLIRNHALQPVAPQPTNPTSIRALTAASPAIHEESSIPGQRSSMGTSAQVAALRNETNAVSSPDSSSHGGKRKGKKNKRKADRQAADVETVPRVKTEPQSPSPLDAPSQIRPRKRQRHGQDASTALEIEPRYEAATAPGPSARFVPDHVEDAGLVGYATTPGYPQRAYSSTAASHVRYSDGQYYAQSWVPIEDPARRPGHAATQYQAGFARAVSQAIVPESYQAGSHPYRDYRDGPRMTAHPDDETFLAPPRPTTARILVDAYGREYIEPSHHSPSRLSAASPSRHGEHEAVYERIPPQAYSRFPAPAPYPEGSIAYAAPPQAYTMPRRIVTQPQYPPHDYRDANQREFSARPLSTAGEFVQVVTPQERRYREDGYIMRSASVRPAQPVRYQVPPDYGREQSVRPELQRPVDYRASVHPEGRHEVAQPYLREYRPAQVQEPVMQRGFSARPADPPQTEQRRAAEDIAYVARPSLATQEIVYADDVGREIYR
ncbi:hypothetical protein AAL_01631 [Moelleriella libera RCEF 2490]|uniref:Uncharacterized protein n=1 Tax=Moelleriella libera RCEF 2490 TaxID=1081109 RepID=A0A166UBC7_9HYPO|nr:hypothetical protein AAL_01631 [Moelleriella libera RCEF 2490]